MTTKTRVVVDLDEVCCDLLTKWLGCYNIDHNTAWTQSDLLTYDMDLTIGNNIYDYLELPGFYRDLMPLNGCRDTLTWAATHFELVIATSRAASAHEDTVAWIDEQLPMIDPDNVVFARNKYLIDGDVLIDDCPRHITAWRGVPLVFGHLPYNRDLPDFIHVPNWTEVRKLLLTLVT